MVYVAYLSLCHKDPSGVVAQARRLTRQGDFVAIHFDRSASNADYAQIRAALRHDVRVVFAPRRRCGWGEWSLVAASLDLARVALEAFPKATHFYLMSGDCMPIKPAHHIRAVLAGNNQDYIEHHDFFKSDWIKTGMRADRLIYRHFFNERTQKRRFYWAYEWQQRLGLQRALPAGIAMRVGSQWWCLRRETLQAVLAFCKTRPDIVRFFRTTWIPDETFFQTLVAHLVDSRFLQNRPPTFLVFTDYGLPVVFCQDHFEFLLQQDSFFARKISPDPKGLRLQLADMYDSGPEVGQTSRIGHRLHGYLTTRGRNGHRFAPRIWARDAQIGHGRVIFVILAKKWHLGKALAQRMQDALDLPSGDYLFDEQPGGLPDLGGLEQAPHKRRRNVRGVLRLLLLHWGRDQMVMCLDPSRLDLLQDLANDGCQLRVLELSSVFDDETLLGHAERIGLLPSDAPRGMAAGLLPALRREIALESERILGANLPSLNVAQSHAPSHHNQQALGAFLVGFADPGQVQAITQCLFQD